MRRAKTFLTLLALLALVSLACSLPALSSSPQESGDRVGTAAAGTAQAMLTQQVIETVVSYLTTTPEIQVVDPLAPPTATLAASSTPFIPTASVTPAPFTSTPVPTATADAMCNAARFVADVTINDGTKFEPGASFTKVWRLKNVGSCIWTTEYSLVFHSGDQMGGPLVTPLNQNVLPNQTVDVSVKLTAPAAAGEYTGYWMLHTDLGVPFGLGTNATKAFYVEIVVTGAGAGSQPGVVAAFTSNYCAAEWETGKQSPLDCPSDESDNGAIWRASSPKMEGGTQDDEPALVMFPSSGSGGYIQGTFPEIKVGNTSRFRAVIGCLDNSPACDVTFRLSYSLNGGPAQSLASWEEKSDNKFHPVEVSLSSLAGQTIRIILRVENNGDPDDDRAFWLVPRITK